MNAIDLVKIQKYVNENIDEYHAKRAEKLQALNLKDLLKRKNPYLYKANNINTVPDLVNNILSAYLSSSDEGTFGNFLEALAIYVSKETTGGWKSGITGIDLEFDNEGVRYLVAVKSGPNWGNSSQWRKLEDNFKTAVGVMRQNDRNRNVQPVCGMCYGKSRTTVSNYMKIYGQNFWHFISGDRDLYTKTIVPLGYRAEEHNQVYLQERDKTINLFTAELTDSFVVDGVIDWDKIVEFNSKNMKDD